MMHKMIILTIIRMMTIILGWTNGQGLITRGVEQWRISNWTSFKTFGTARRNLKVNEIHDDQFCGVCKNTNTNINKNTDDRIKKQMKQMYRVIYVRQDRNPFLIKGL